MKNKQVPWQLLIILVLGLIASIHMYSEYENKIIENTKDFQQENTYHEPTISTPLDSEFDNNRDIQLKRTERHTDHHIIEKRS
ncbi:MAG: hypothetical protein ACEPOV_05755 [Hyphomicrobiales bacterium]